MAAGLGYKEFTTGDILTAADANGYLASQVVMVFASAAARTSAIASPQEGMISYLKDTNSTEYYSGSAWVAIAGAAGSRGLNEVIPSSVAVGSGTATVGANGKVTFTTVGTNLSINGCFTSTYTNYKMVMDFDDTGSNGTNVRLRVGGTDNSTASSYVSQSLQAQASTVSTGRTTFTYWSDPFFGNSNSTNAVEMNFYRPFDADQTGFSTLALNSASGGHLFVACGTHNQATSYDGFSIIIGSTDTLTGALRVYGWNE